MAKKIISPGQAVLLLIAHYQKQPSNAADVKILTSLYLNGIRDPKENSLYEQYLASNKKLLQPYVIKKAPDVINNDPTRRYFETHLAYEILVHDLNEVKTKNLVNHVVKLEKLLNTHDPERYYKCFSVLEGKTEPSDSNLFKEYADYMVRLKKGELFKELNADQKLIVELFIRASFLAVNCAQSTAINKVSPLPLDIYGSGFYAEDARGKELLPTTSQENPNHAGTVRSKHFGLMKGHMPLPSDDIAMAESIIPFLKGSDQSRFVFGKLWPALNFSRLMHPFSNSISGSVLCQLRILALFNQQKSDQFTQSHQAFQSFFKLYIATILFYNGGHSLFEFTTPLMLPAVRKEFSKNNINFDALSIENIFSSDPVPLKNALAKAIDYNDHYLLKQSLNQEITTFKWPKRKRVNDLEENKKIRLMPKEDSKQASENGTTTENEVSSPTKRS